MYQSVHSVRQHVCESLQTFRVFLSLMFFFCFLQQDVEKFTDIEKLYLYLKLPSGPSSGNDKRYVRGTHITQVFHFALWLFFSFFFSSHTYTNTRFVVALITLSALSHCLSKIHWLLHRQRIG